MGNEIVINVRPYETRVALLENKNISEIYIERASDRGLIGNIYRGRVKKILPGMQVAFVDIGFERSGFLHHRDVTVRDKDFMPGFNETTGPDQGEDADTLFGGDIESTMRPKTPAPIENLLTNGQEIMVQVIKEPIGGKGMRLGSYITLPGRYLVFMPMIDQIGVSRRILDTDERERLRSIVAELRNPDKGYIIRTAAETVSREELKKDIDYLNRAWEGILAKNERSRAPTVIYSDLDIILRSLRDLSQRELGRVTIDSPEDYERCVEFINNFIAEPRPGIELYSSMEPIFDSFGLEMEIERALGRRVWLKSGGFIAIDQTEALTAVDVNTGKFIGKRSQEETILKTNLEAVKEIVYQLKLRNIGGLIILDFIDMEKEQSKEMVYNSLEQALTTDRSRTRILRVSEFGLVEMTRKRTRENLSRVLNHPCPYCEGKGVVKSPETVCYEIFREIERCAFRNPIGKKILLEVSHRIANAIYENENEFLEKLESERNYKISIKSISRLQGDQFEVTVLDAG
ncbi:MAG: ribonuclease G [bacterium]|nr:MAG: ribonuclease G [bacterium]